MSDEGRREELRRLLAAPVPLEGVIGALSRMPWDVERPLATFRREHARAALDRYLAGELEATYVARWAEALEVREDVEPAPDDPVLKEILFELANPELTAPLTPSRAAGLLRRLGEVEE